MDPANEMVKMSVRTKNSEALEPIFESDKITTPSWMTVDGKRTTEPTSVRTHEPWPSQIPVGVRLYRATGTLRVGLIERRRHLPGARPADALLTSGFPRGHRSSSWSTPSPCRRQSSGRSFVTVTGAAPAGVALARRFNPSKA